MKKLVYTLLLVVSVIGSAISQGTFYSETFGSGIPAGWTVTGENGTSDLWAYTTDGAAGAYQIADILSTTAGDGWMIFDSDLLCSGNQDAWLKSGAIDCSGQGSVQLRFQQQYRRFFDQTFVEVSTDGVNWTEIEVNTGLANNAFCAGNPELVSVDISAVAANQPTVYIAWRFWSIGGGNYGCGYSWHIDDVELGSTPQNETSIVFDTYVAAPSFSTPASQTQATEVLFGATLRNAGALDQTNVTLAISVDEIGTGANVFTDAVVLGTLTAGVDSAVVTANTYFPDNAIVPGIYQVSYELTQDNADGNPLNNVDTTFFVVTDSIYSKVFYNPGTSEMAITGALAPGGGPTPWKWGLLYDIVNGGTKAEKISFAIASNDPDLNGVHMDLGLYEVIDDNGDGFLDDVELTAHQVGFGTWDFTTEANYDVITTEIYDIATFAQGVDLNANSTYFVTLEYNGAGQIFFAQSNTVPYDPYIAATNSVIRPVNTGGTWYLGGFSGDVTPSILLHLSNLPIGVNQVPANPAQVSLSPNPASDNLTVNVNFGVTERFVQYEVSDVLGKVVFSTRRENVSSETFNYDVKGLAAGTYTFTIRSAQGVKSERFVVTK